MRFLAMLGICLTALVAQAAQLTAPNPAARRAALLALARGGQASPSRIARMLDDADMVVRRTAARVLAALEPLPVASLAEALGNTDPGVRATAAWALRTAGSAALPQLKRAASDADPYVRQTAVLAASCMRPSTPDIRAIILKANADEKAQVRTAAQVALANFYTVVQQLRLPKDGWAFKLDPKDEGRKAEWFQPDLDDSKWKRIAIEQAWQKAGFDYIGPAWYRRTITLPAKPEMELAELRFGGVDEGAWVWVNGQYAGEHDIGPSGWNKPFALDVTALVRWGQPNQITVRARNTACAGGIWRPVKLVALKPAD